MCATLTSSPLSLPLLPPAPLPPYLPSCPSLPLSLPRPSTTSMPSVCPANGFCRSWFSSFNKHYCQDNPGPDEALARGGGETSRKNGAAREHEKDEAGGRLPFARPRKRHAELTSLPKSASSIISKGARSRAKPKPPPGAHCLLEYDPHI